MKNHTGLIISGVSLISILMLMGCEKSGTENGFFQPVALVKTDHISDEQVTKNVQIQLRNDELLHEFAINVSTRKGDVMLTGQVDEPAKIAYADRLVMGIDGAHSVHNHLVLKD